MAGRKAERAGARRVRRVRRTDAAYVARGGQERVLQVAHSEGSYLWDVRGRRYVDFEMGWCVGNLGWNHPAILERMRAYRGPSYVHATWVHPPRAELAKRLAEVAPGALTKTFRATGGSEAVDIALQLAMAYTGRRAFVAIDGAYHGNVVGAVSVGDKSSREPYPNLLQRCHRLKPPLDDKALGRLERLLQKREVAALIMEPIVMNLAVLLPEEGFIREAARLCRRFGTLFIADEVACGFGRTGRLFASEHFGLEPDILCLAKALTGGHAPIGATMVTERIAKKLGEDVAFHSTYGWHPLSVEAALATLGVFRSSRRLFDNVEHRGAQLEARLWRLPWASPAKIRRRGLAVAVQFEDDGYGDEVAQACKDAGLLSGGEGDALCLFPALNVEEATVEEGLGILERCVWAGASQPK